MPLKLALVLNLLLFCSCATEHWTGPLPSSEVTINQDAGAGGLILVMLRLESGEEMPFVVDTGAPGTLFDTSLVPKLGKRLPLGSWTVATLNERQKSPIYHQPKLYLGNRRLRTGSLTATLDLKQLSTATGQPIKGILGMDCLKHYCIQLDFDAGKLRFIPANNAAIARPGKAFPLAFSFPGHQPSIRHAGLAGTQSTVLRIDTGFNMDGQVEAPAVKGRAEGIESLAECVWDSETYTNLLVGVGADSSRLGLRFLARHLVTLDFPNRTLYLQRQRLGPRSGQTIEAAAGNAAAKSAVEFLRSLLKEGRLPGWSKGDEVAAKTVAFDFQNLNSATCDHFLKKGDSSIYHYQLTRASQNSPWELQKAWRTDPEGRTLEQYPVR